MNKSIRLQFLNTEEHQDWWWHTTYPDWPGASRICRYLDTIAELRETIDSLRTEAWVPAVPDSGADEG